jgi:aspartate/methionine/tyrosine aminotransferase
MLEVPRALGCEISFIKRRPDPYRIDVRELREKLEKGADLLVLQNHNNPSGKAIQGPDLIDIAKACADNGVPVLCDEVYRDFALSPSEGGLKNPLPSMVQLYEKGITTGSVTKVYGAGGLVTGWMVAGKRTVQRARKAKIMIDPMVSNWGNKVALAILKNRDMVLPGAFAELREKLRLVMTWAKGRDDVHWSEPDGTAIGFLRYEHDLPSLEFCERLYRDYETRAIPGEFFHIEKGVRIGLTRPYEEIKGGLGMLDRFLDDLSKGR